MIFNKNRLISSQQSYQVNDFSIKNFGKEEDMMATFFNVVSGSAFMISPFISGSTNGDRLIQSNLNSDNFITATLLSASA